MNLNNKKILVVGVGKSGIAAVRLLQQRGIPVKATDKYICKNTRILKNEGVEIEIGHMNSSFIDDVDCVIISPGVSDTCEVITWARERKIPLISEIELAAHFLKAPLIAVTGTNGKTTTTSLITHIFNVNGIDAVSCGNIGYPLSTACIEHSQLDYYVCELSSFQLERIHTFTPHISVLLNITPDHGDRYESVLEYQKAKLNMYQNQGSDQWAVANIRCKEIVHPIVTRDRIKTFYFGLSRDSQADIFYENDAIIMCVDGNETVLCNREDIKIPGHHNVENIMAALLCAYIGKVSTEGCRQALKTFYGVTHRLEYVDTLNGVRFINDSKSTNIDSLSVAIESFDMPIILIAGGRNKGGDFGVLGEAIKEKVSHIVCIGEAADEIETSLNAFTNVEKQLTLKAAVNKSYEIAEAGSVVLLSPGCASFDMFKDYEDRGNKFKKIVQGLKKCSS